VSSGPAKSLGFRLFIGGCVVLLANSVYLAASADPTFLYFTNVALHPIFGIALTLGAIVMRRRLSEWTRGVKLRPLLVVSLFALGIAITSGLAILVFGATRPFRPLVTTHVVASFIGSALLATLLWRTVLDLRWYRLSRAVAAGIAVLLIAISGVAVAQARRDADWRDAHRIENPTAVPARMEGEGRGPTSPFFPSSADTNVRGLIPANFFLTSEACGRCHRDIYEQWRSSAHHFSSFNNQWYRKSIEYMQDVVGTTPSKWCAGCHDHAVFFNGRFDRPIKEQIETPEAQAGLSCTSCHSITRVNSTMGQGDFEIEYPPLHDLAASSNPLARRLHDKLLELDPQPHREMFLKPFHREQTPEFCSSCHKVHLDVPVNAYRWFRGFNDYDNWQASGVSGEGARSFYYPARSQKCADCHMALVDSNDPAAKNGKVRSHRFAAANTALPYVNGDTVQLKAVQDFLKDGQVSVDIFGIARVDAPKSGSAGKVRGDAEAATASMFAVGEEALNMGPRQAVSTPPAEVLGPLGSLPVAVRRGESIRLEVVVRTRKVGHFFPGGTVDAFDVWIELEAVDDRGRKIFHSGALQDGSGPVDPGAHLYRSLLLDEHGNPINKRNAWAARSSAYVRLIPPGAADTIHYRLDIPDDAGNQIFLKAKLNYRKFSWWNTNWAFAGVRDLQVPFSLTKAHDDGRWVFTGDTSKVSGPHKAIPNLPVTQMAEAQASLLVLSKGADVPLPKQSLNPSVRERWNDYGIGLLLQGDIKAAEAAFLKVTEMEPGYADGWVNVGRARIQEGNMAAAEEVLRKALEVQPGLAKTHFFLGTALKSLGRYDEAIEHLRRSAGLYPRDRVVLNQLGRVLFLKRQYREAIAEFDKVLKIDPEDLQAHYNLMLCYQGLGDSSRADAERVLYERFKADESAQAITGDYRRLNPHDNNERQQIHEHRSAPL
jgi:tetratricopeptide (TPR) repeat protein